MNIEYHVIVIPGLGNNVTLNKWAIRHFTQYGLIPHVFDARWKVEEPDFTKKFQRALQFVDSLVKPNASISIIGNSAGSSFALNIFGKRRKNINAVIINCGRIRTGDWPWFTFDQATASSPSFRKSVLMAQKVEKALSHKDREKILTLRPIFDEVVPPSTVPILGARNELVYSLEHSITIALNLTLLDRRIIDFILRSQGF